jgi:hypothetical protein
MFQPTWKIAMCHDLVFLPHRIPEGKSVSQPDWPTDTWHLDFVCQVCGRRAIYSAANVHYNPSDTLDQGQPAHVLWRVVLECAHEGCGTVFELHTNADYHFDKNEVLAVLRRANPAISCPQGHIQPPIRNARSVQAVKNLV